LSFGSPVSICFSLLRLHRFFAIVRVARFAKPDQIEEIAHHSSENETPEPIFDLVCVRCGSDLRQLRVAAPSSCLLGLSVACAFRLFGFFENADSHNAPAPYRSTAVGAGDEAVVCCMIWDVEFIAAALKAPERSIHVHLLAGAEAMETA
jgi:hypothetical protein